MSNMAQVKISALPQVENVKDNDIFAGVNTDSSTTMKATAKQIKDYVKKDLVFSDIGSVPDFALAENVYDKTEIDTKVQEINTTTNGLDTRLTTAEKNIETNKTDIKNLSNRTKRIETDIFDSGEASGTGINLQDSTLAEFQEVKIDGVGNQVTTNGNQLIDMANPMSKSTGVTSTFENDVLTIVGTAGAIYQSASWSLSKTLLENNKGKTIKYKHKSANISNQEASCTVQISVGYTDDTPTFYKRIYNFNTMGTDTYVIPSDISNISYINVGIYTNNSANTNVESTVTIEEPLLYFDDNDTYEKFTGAEPSPSPDYEQPIEVIEDDFELVSCGANLIDWSNVKSGSFNAIGKYENDILTVTSENPQTYPAITYDITNILKRYENKKLKFICEDSHVSNEDAAANVQMTIVTNNNKTQYISLYNIKTKNNTPFTILKNIKSATVGVYANNSSTAVVNTSTIVKPMLFIYNNEDVNIEPYTETRQTITMPENEFAGKIDDTYKDQFRINYNEEDGKYHLYLDKVVGKVVLDGSRDEVYSVQQATTNTDMAYVYTRILDNLALSSLGKSNNFIRTNDLQMDSDKGESFAITSATSGNNLRFFIKKDRLSEISQTGFRSYLNTNNVEIYYALKEPYTLDLGVVNMPLSYYPITNVYNTCVGIPNMYVKYYRDFKKTITTMQVDIENLKEAVSTLTSNQTSMDNDISTLQNVVSSSLEETESEVTNDDNLQGQ